MSVQFLTQEKIEQQNQHLCLTCRIPCKLSLKFQCIHCGATYYIYTCPKCGNEIIIPDLIPIVKLEVSR